ncbi:uncharacterized protein [Haliaeetus albicilla]|uniref:uncharacterized protein n=1 Tax=Haliaeetus albicilla TaxID=8969 RepID=UPI0037E75BA5
MESSNPQTFKAAKRKGQQRSSRLDAVWYGGNERPRPGCEAGKASRMRGAAGRSKRGTAAPPPLLLPPGGQGRNCSAASASAAAAAAAVAARWQRAGRDSPRRCRLRRGRGCRFLPRGRRGLPPPQARLCPASLSSRPGDRQGQELPWMKPERPQKGKEEELEGHPAGSCGWRTAKRPELLKRKGGEVGKEVPELSNSPSSPKSKTCEAALRAQLSVPLWRCC